MYREYKRCAFSIKNLSPVVGFPVALFRYLKPKSYTRCQFFTSFMPLQWRSIALLNKVFLPSRFVVFFVNFNVALVEVLSVTIRSKMALLSFFSVSMIEEVEISKLYTSLEPIDSLLAEVSPFSHFCLVVRDLC